MPTVELSPGFRPLRVVAAAALAFSLLPLGAAFAAGTTLRVTPGSLSFGAEVFGVSGATSKAKTVTISNLKSAAQPATIATIALGGADPHGFLIDDLNNCSGTTLNPGEKCAVNVTFTPTKLGTLSSTLTVTDSGGLSAKPVGLKGSGVPGALQFKPHTLSFPKTQRGTLSAPLPVTLTNKNTVALFITSITAEGFAADGCLGILAPGISCPVSVEFSPPPAKSSKTSRLTGVLEIADDAAASPQKVQVSGVAFGTAPTPTPTPTATSSPTPTPTPTPTPSPTPAPCASGICGQVTGGLTPIANSSITLFAVSATGYGSGATSLGTLASGADGSFDLSSYTCPAGNPQTYITASGGNAGAGANSAIGLMAMLGPCNSLSTSTTIGINELTTAAAQWALAQFFDSGGHTIGAPPTNATGLKNAYLGFANLADINSNTLAVSGNPSSLLPGPETCAAVSPPANCDALERLNTLSNILAGCVDSSGPSSSACAELFCDATPGLTYSGACSGTPAITDTMGAAHLIVSNPANSVNALYGLAAASAPFRPALGAAPDGWEIGLDFAPASAAFNELASIALDGSGNVFAANINGSSMGNFGSVSELTAASGYATGLNFAPPGASFDVPYSMAVDGSGDLFVANQGGHGINASVSELTAASSYATGLNFAPAGAEFASPQSIALDGSSNVFVANEGNLTTNLGSVSELTAGSGYATGLNFNPPGASFDFLVSIALDGSNDVFAANYGNSASELTAASSYATGVNFAAAAAAFKNPISIALDGSGNVFAANTDGGSGNFGSVSELTAGSSYATGFDFAPAGAAFNNPISIALDGSGNLFVANEIGDSNNGSVSELTAASSYATGLNFAPSGAAFNNPVSIALDGSGNLFAANFSSVSEILGLAKPVITPVQSCLVYWSNRPGHACVP